MEYLRIHHLLKYIYIYNQLTNICWSCQTTLVLLSDRTCVQASKVSNAIIYERKTMYKEKRTVHDGNPFTRSKRQIKAQEHMSLKNITNKDTTNTPILHIKFTSPSVRTVFRHCLNIFFFLGFVFCVS